MTRKLVKLTVERLNDSFDIKTNKNKTKMLY